MEYYHVYPVKDLFEHHIECISGFCFCNPELEFLAESDTMLVIHEALDGREKIDKRYLCAKKIAIEKARKLLKED